MRALDGELVDVVGGGARVHRLHHVVPQVLAHLQGNYIKTKKTFMFSLESTENNDKKLTMEWSSVLKWKQSGARKEASGPPAVAFG